MFAKLFKINFLAIIIYCRNIVKINIKTFKIRLYYIWLVILLLYIIVLSIVYLIIFEAKLSSYITIIDKKRH